MSMNHTHQEEASFTLLSRVQAAIAQMAKFKAQGSVWSPAYYPYRVDHHPDGIRETQLDTLMQSLLALSDNNVIIHQPDSG